MEVFSEFVKINLKQVDIFEPENIADYIGAVGFECVLGKILFHTQIVFKFIYKIFVSCVHGFLLVKGEA